MKLNKPEVKGGLMVYHQDARGQGGFMDSLVLDISKRIQEEVDPNLWVFWDGKRKTYQIMMAMSVDKHVHVMSVDREDFHDGLILRLLMADTTRRDVQGEMQKFNERHERWRVMDEIDRNVENAKKLKFDLDKPVSWQVNEKAKDKI